jgi:predicted ester cyclase
MSNKETAFKFFGACDTGKGWGTCKEWCHEAATFSCQADALAEITTLEGYADWMAGLLIPVPDGRYELRSFSEDVERGNVSAFAVFHGTNTGEGAVPPTGKKIAADYVYVMDFDGNKIRHMTKIWNDVHSLKQLGWA